MLASSKGKQPVRNVPDAQMELEDPRPTFQRKRPSPISIVQEIPDLPMTGGPFTHSPKPMSTPTTPIIVITVPEDEEPRFIARRRSGGMRTGPFERPRMPRKAATAPPGVFGIVAMAPQPPRRAISARMVRPGLGRGSSARGGRPGSPGFPRISQHGTSESRSIISRRKNTNKWTGRVGFNMKTSTWKKLPSPLLKRYEMISDELRGSKRISFSEKARVKETLKNKKLEPLRTNIVDFQKKELPDTPISLVSTPRELYGTPGDRLRPSPQPYGSSLERRSAVRTGSGEVKHFSLPLSLPSQRRDSLTRSLSWQDLRLAEPSKQNVYLPGPIRLAERVSARLSRPFSFVVPQPGAEIDYDESTQLSELAAMDAMAAYFEGFGFDFVPPAAEDEVDRYWEEGSDVKAEAEALSEAVLKETTTTTTTMGLPSPKSPDWKARVRLGLDEAPPPSPTKPGRPGHPRSPSHASSTATVTAIATPSPTLSSLGRMTRQQDDKDDEPSAALALVRTTASPGGRHRLRDFLRSSRSSR